MVAAHKSTKKDVLERIVKNIKNVGGNLAGVVINKIPVSSKAYGERYYYYGERDTKNKKKKPSRKESGAKKIEEKNKERIMKTMKIEKKHDEKKSVLKTNNDILKDNTSFSNMGMNKTNEILKQVNDYIEKEKKDLL